MILLNESYTFVDTGVATSLHFLYPLFVSILCFIFYGEKLKRRQLIAMMFALLGIACFMNKGSGSLFGYIIAILSGLTYAYYLVKMDKTGLVRMCEYKLSFYLALFTFFEIVIINVFISDVVFYLDFFSYLLLLILSLSSSFIATVLLQKGVLLLGSTRASFICLLEPITAMVMGIIFLGEAISFSKLFGAICVVISLLVFLLKK